MGILLIVGTTWARTREKRPRVVVSAPVATRPAAVPVPAVVESAALQPKPSPPPAVSIPPSQSAEAGTFTPEHLGPGVVLKPDLDRAPLVPPGTAVAEYVTGYHEALLAGDWGRAMSLVPADGSRDDVERFRRRLSGYGPGAFHVVTSGEADRVGAALVSVTTPDNGVWNVTWEFARTGRGLVVKTLKYARPGATGCH